MPVCDENIIDDIEDIVGVGHDTDLRSGNKKHVVPKAKKFSGKNVTSVSADSVIPGINKAL